MDHWRDQSEKPLEIKEIRYGGEPCQPHPGTQCHRCGCSLPGLTGFTADRCGGTDRAHHDEPAWRRAAPLYRLIDKLQPLSRCDPKAEDRIRSERQPLPSVSQGIRRAIR